MIVPVWGTASAVHFYFGRHLMQVQPDVPVGLITSAVGATAIERWATCAGSGSLYTGQIVPLQPYGIRGQPGIRASGIRAAQATPKNTTGSCRA